MQYFFFTISFLTFSLLLSVSAQSHRRVNTSGQQERSIAEASHSASSYQMLTQEKEVQLSRLLRQYQGGTPATRQRLQPQIETLLYDLFDLNIAEKEAEAVELRQQLNRLEADVAYHNRSEEILRLKQSLALVEAVIRERKMYRQQIVNRRLQELLSL